MKLYEYIVFFIVSKFFFSKNFYLKFYLYSARQSGIGRKISYGITDLPVIDLYIEIYNLV